MDDREAANRVVREHLESMRARLAAGREELERLQTSISDTRQHIADMQRWQEETSRLREEDDAAA